MQQVVLSLHQDTATVTAGVVNFVRSSGQRRRRNQVAYSGRRHHFESMFFAAKVKSMA